MRKSLYLFLFIIGTLLLVAPVWNIIKYPISKLSFKRLYNIDDVMYLINSGLYKIGVSTEPLKAIIGYDGWLYLGDGFKETVSVSRKKAGIDDYVLGKAIDSNMSCWNERFVEYDVKVFRVMIGPNKKTVYPEYMPEWSRPEICNKVKAVLSAQSHGYIIDLGDLLIDEKQKVGIPLYYKTDTHWNSFGAAMAFKGFASIMSGIDADLRWPEKDIYEVKLVNKRKGGDLSMFLHLENDLSDSEPFMKYDDNNILFEGRDYETGSKVKLQGIYVGYSKKPVIIKNINAINHKKVLWLRDSFGTALSPLMSITFSDVMHLHYADVAKGQYKLDGLIKKWHPDYVFITVVEREAIDLLQKPITDIL